ncbi:MULTISPECIES: P-loop NTPase fold protein [Phyllobacteriaceae]|jgi:KAP family P-loop domain|uniref:KAP NTPase domain-containing protein n=1 Tax=Mesorhizobium hungaricum TaxID=1566387 RepID=A0A1C2EEF0_9HYPH|nr:MULTISPECIES: P-loop NTPase fold protein [Mesorhizobium]MBN9237770.1 hypothetical protein [Mesorhizobium sp.]MDQ0327721.1 hypothetical protein [Mesorhizobium sp. YL-MeA3-2017]OCX25307.1 hypothetical protein QV13_00515 [Mesorhizobium hungaricum]
MTETPTKPHAQILTGNAADDDAFAGGGHTRTATALADTISQIGTRDGAIGLEGSWGTGKSMVIKLAAKALPKGKYDLFTFDLWRHQTDNFRRLFLEEFVAWLEQQKYLTTTEVTHAISRIRDRTQTIGTDRFSLYTWPGLVFLLLLALAPIGYSHLTADAPPVFPGAPPIVPDTVFWGLNWPQIITLIVPFLFVVWVIGRAIKLMWNPAWRRGATDRSLLYALSETAMIFSNEKKRETIEQNIRDEDPTAFEFYGLFRDLLSKAQKDKRRIVFVLDNIDRLPRDEVRAAWSQMWAVFSPNPSQIRGPAAHVIAVIPYDRGHVLSAFSGTGEGHAVETSGGDPNIDLFEKTFDRVIRVAPPVTSDWKSFLDAKLVEAFGLQISGEAHLDDRYHLYRILQLALRDKSLMATPRRIISFVNEVGALWVQWGHSIPIVTIGFYVLHREIIEADPTVIAKGLFPQQSLTHLPSAWTDHLAALCFNVEPLHARQVLLADPIAKAFTSIDAGDLNGWKEATGFETTAYEVLDSDAHQWAQSPQILSRAAINLEKVELESSFAKNCWNMLGDSLPSLGSIQEQPAAAFAGLCKIIEHLDTNRAAKAAIFLRNYMSPPANLRPAPEVWAASMVDLFDALERSAGKDTRISFQRDTQPPDDANFCINAAAAFSPTKYSFGALSCRVKPAMIIETLKQTASDAPNIARLAIPELDSLLRPHSKQLNPLIEVIAGILRSPADLLDKGHGDRLGMLAELVEIAGRQKEVRTTLRAVVEDGTLLWHAFTAEKTSVPRAADGLWLIVSAIGTTEHTPPATHPNLGDNTAAIAWYKSIRMSSSGFQEFIDALSAVVSNRGRFSDWTNYAISTGSTAPLFPRVLRKVVEEHDYWIDSNLKWMSDFDRLRETIGQDTTTLLLQQLAEEKIDWRKAIDDVDILNLSPQLARDIAMAPEGQAPSEILKIVDDKLGSLSGEDWLAALSNSTGAVGLLITRVEDSDVVLSPAAFGEAIKKHTLEICVEETRREYRPDWPQICKALPVPNTKTIAFEVLNALATTTSTPTGVAHYIEMYHPIAIKMPLDKNPDAAVGAFLHKLAISPSERVLQFVRQRQKDMKHCLEKASPDEVKALDNTLRGQLRGEDNALVERVRIMIDLLGFEPEQAEEEAANQTDEQHQ